MAKKPDKPPKESSGKLPGTNKPKSEARAQQPNKPKEK